MFFQTFWINLVINKTDLVVFINTTFAWKEFDPNINCTNFGDLSY